MSDLRIYKGLAKYKGGFDVPKPYTPVGIEPFRTSADTCKNNFATLNSLYLYGNTNTSYVGNITLRDGNLTAGWTSGTGSNQHARSNFGMTSGKWYCEVRMNSLSGGDFGVAFENHINDSVGYGSDQLGFSYRSDGQKQNSTSSSGYGGAFDTGDILGCAYDADAGSIQFYRNGTSQGTAFTGISKNQPAFFGVGKASSGATMDASVNFGQNQTFGSRAAVNKNRVNSSTADSVWHQSSNTGNHNDWTVSSGGTKLDVAVSGGNYARAKLRAVDGTIDPKKTYLVSFKYVSGPANLGVQNDHGYMTALDGSASPSGLSPGNYYSFIIQGTREFNFTGFTGSTYSLDEVVVSEIDECYTDDNGIGKFHYEPPTGFLALCEDNLPTPAVADPGKYFKSVLYTGSGGSKAITGVGFKPDLVWVKCRSDSKWHALVDSVRGNTKTFHSNSPSAQTSEIHVPSFDDNGFTVADIDSGTANENGFTYVAWCWKAGGPAVTNTEGNITTQVSANPEAGFSIIRSPGPGTSGHGLNSTPKFIIQKSIGTGNWNVAHHKLYAPSSTGKILLNLNGGVVASGTTYMHEATATTFDPLFSADQMAYVWAEVENFSKFGSYIGNENADGSFIYCGFKPAFVITKRIDGNSNWLIHDSSRDPVNPVMGALYANEPDAEGSAVRVDFVSNGFKHRNADGGTANNYANNYIFAAFAESPFQTANAK